MSAAVRRRTALTGVALFIVVVVVTGAQSPAAAQSSSEPVYRPPVDSPVHDPFRAPDTPYGPGHRGVEYDTAPGTPVAAVTQGTVVFAGEVAGVLWVSVRHPDGVRTTYGPMAALAVGVGQSVTTGAVVGTTSGRLLLTARLDGNYFDPAQLFADGDQVHLMPDVASLPSFPSSSFGPGDLLSPDALVDALSWTRDRAAEQVTAVYGVTPVPYILHTVDALVAWRDRQNHCTSGDVPVAVPTTRRARDSRGRPRFDERGSRHRRRRHGVTRLRPR